VSNKSKQAGTKFETAIVNYINEWAGEKVCERIVMYGNKDHGDIRLKVDDFAFTIEAKWRKKYPNDALEQDFRKQTDTETRNAYTDGGLLVMNKYGCNISRAEVWMRIETACRIFGTCDLMEPSTDDSDWLCMRMSDFCQTCFGDPATQ